MIFCYITKCHVKYYHMIGFSNAFLLYSTYYILFCEDLLLLIFIKILKEHRYFLFLRLGYSNVSGSTPTK